MGALLEEDGHLCDAEAVVVHAVDHLLEEGVAGASHAEGVHRLEYAAPVAAEARRAVAHRHAEQCAGVQVREAREQAAGERPVGDASARHVARADHEVGVLAGREQLRQVARVVAAVAVHRQHPVGAGVEAEAEAREVGAAQPELCRAPQQMQPWLVAARALDEIAGAIGARVIDDERFEPGILREHGARDRQDVSGFVVGGEDHQRAHVGRAAYQKRDPGPRPREETLARQIALGVGLRGRPGAAGQRKEPVLEAAGPRDSEEQAQPDEKER